MVEHQAKAKSTKSLANALSKNAEDVSGVLKQLAHPVRLKILCTLIEGEKSVGELVESCDASQSFISQLLSRMKAENLVVCRKDANFAFYRISDERLIKVMRTLRDVYCR